MNNDPYLTEATQEEGFSDYPDTEWNDVPKWNELPGKEPLILDTELPTE
jgi:hypothetical protein